MHADLLFFLHAHLPFVRHPEHDDFLEEDWLFEAILETYLPLIRIGFGWAEDELDARVGMSLSPTLTSMLGDPLLRTRFGRRLERLVRLVDEMPWPQDDLRPALEDQRARLHGLRALYEDVLQRDLLGPLAELDKRGALELATCVATHAFLPLYARDLEDARPHVRVAVKAHRDVFGRYPPGIWLPECGFVPGLDRVLADEGLAYFFVDSHAFASAQPVPVHGVHAPVVCSSGTLAFARDPATARAVWSADEGYPGDGRYLEFHRDQGFELPEPLLQGLLQPTGARRHLGVKLHRITRRDLDLAQKAPYDPVAARSAVTEHAAHFLRRRRQAAESLASRVSRPLFVAPFDAELFGHWWHEGPAFLDAVVRHAAGFGLGVVSPTQVIRGGGPYQVSAPGASSWGVAGHGQMWLNEINDWIWPHLHHAAPRMAALAGRHPGAQGVLRRALDQLARELLLASASDWPFMMSTGTTVQYAEARVRRHVQRFLRLADQIEADAVDEAWLARIEAQDNVLPGLDAWDFAPSSRRGR